MCSHMHCRFLSPCQSPLKRLYGNAVPDCVGGVDKSWGCERVSIQASWRLKSISSAEVPFMPGMCGLVDVPGSSVGDKQ